MWNFPDGVAPTPAYNRVDEGKGRQGDDTEQGNLEGLVPVLRIAAGRRGRLRRRIAGEAMRRMWVEVGAGHADAEVQHLDAPCQRYDEGRRVVVATFFENIGRAA